MNITVYRIGKPDGYEVVRRTSPMAPEWVYFIVQTHSGSRIFAAWAVDTSRREGFLGFLHRLRIAFPLTNWTTAEKSSIFSYDSCYAQVEPSIDIAFNKACRYAERLADISEETSREIDRHVEEIRYRNLARAEVEQVLLVEASAS